MKCSVCGSTKNMIIPRFNLSTGKPDPYICDECSTRKYANSISDIKKLDEEIKKNEKMCKDYEKLIQEIPDFPKMPKGLESFAYTPLSAYNIALRSLAILKTRRMELLVETGSEAKLKYNLEQALENEDFEKAATIRDKLEKLKEEEE